MKNLLLLIAICLLMSCGNQNSIQTEEMETPKQSEISIIKENEDELTAKFLMPVKGTIDSLLETMFEESTSTGIVVDSVELLLDDYKQALFLLKIDSNFKAPYPLYDNDLIKEYAKDTLWLLTEIYSTMYLINGNSTSLDMGKTTIYRRELANKLVNKYYQILLSVLSDVDKSNLITAHEKWQKSIDSDYVLTGRFARNTQATMSFFSWSTEVDRLLLQRIIFYYDLYQHRLPDNVTMTDFSEGI